MQHPLKRIRGHFNDCNLLFAEDFIQDCMTQWKRSNLERSQLKDPAFAMLSEQLYCCLFKINHLKHFSRPEWGGNGRGVCQLWPHVIKNYLRAIGFFDLGDVMWSVIWSGLWYGLFCDMVCSVTWSGLVWSVTWSGLWHGLVWDMVSSVIAICFMIWLM